ncbi:MAG: hypothetical protein MIO92_02675 [Methanosarcinaceae archaeon]|nr:hypothetical protein [Methanosarcinaceae archaeon]
MEALVISIWVVVLFIVYAVILFLLPFYVIAINSKVLRMEKMVSDFLVLYKEDKDIIKLTDVVS